MKKHLKFTLFFSLGVIVISPMFFTSCGVGNSQTQSIINLVKDNFSKESIELGKVKDKTEALKKYKELFNEQTKKDEILFDQFNFIGKKDLTINNMKLTPADNSIIDLYEQSKCNINSQYDIIVDEFINDNNYFMYRFQGYITIQFTTDINSDGLNIKKGDYIQFVYDIQERVYLNLSIENNGNTKLQYTFNKINNNISQTFGFIKLTLNSDPKTTLSISDMEEVNYCNHNKVFGYYSIE